MVKNINFKNIKFIVAPIKLLILIVTFIAPFIFVTYQLISEINLRIDFTNKESVGIEYNQSMRQLLEKVQKHNLLSQLYLLGDISIKTEWENSTNQTSNYIQEIDATDKELNPILKTTDKWTAIFRNWQSLLLQEPTMSPEQSGENHKLIVAQIVSLINHVGDSSNLNFDPSLDSYYLMIALVRHLPRNLESLDQLRNFVANKKKTQITIKERAELIIRHGISKSSMVEIKRGLETAFSVDASLRPPIGFHLKESLLNNEVFISLVNQILVGESAEIDLQGQDYISVGNQAIQSQYKLYDAIAPALQNLLQIRVNSLQDRRRQVRLFTLMVLAVFIYIFLSLASNQRKRLRAEKNLRQQQEKTEMLLLNVLPQAIASRLKDGDEAIADNFAEVTVLFADIVGFTEISSRIAPQQVVSLLNQVFSAFDYLAEIHGLEKIKTVGDAYMVVGGLPNPRTDHVEAVLDMALDMRVAISKVSQELGEDCQIRIGVNTGPVVAGVIGIKKFIYDLWGDTVNVASRMESQGIPGEIQITAETYKRVRHKYKFQERGIVQVKGKGEMLAYLLLGKT